MTGKSETKARGYSDEEFDFIADLWASRKSAAEIEAILPTTRFAREVPRTRNAILGLIHRHGLKRGSEEGNPTRSRKSNARRSVAPVTVAKCEADVGKRASPWPVDPPIVTVTACHGSPPPALIEAGVMAVGSLVITPSPEEAARALADSLGVAIGTLPPPAPPDEEPLAIGIPDAVVAVRGAPGQAGSQCRWIEGEGAARRFCPNQALGPTVGPLRAPYCARHANGDDDRKGVAQAPPPRKR